MFSCFARRTTAVIWNGCMAPVEQAVHVYYLLCTGRCRHPAWSCSRDPCTCAGLGDCASCAPLVILMQFGSSQTPFVGYGRRLCLHVCLWEELRAASVWVDDRMSAQRWKIAGVAGLPWLTCMSERQGTLAFSCHEPAARTSEHDYSWHHILADNDPWFTEGWWEVSLLGAGLCIKVHACIWHALPV